ncbi:AbrB/MazE/SpoVT family DNA-binding domain-containing protein [Paenibacillus thiaminolyticus]|uniref:AbrB/MazE/SpoVT family DNA-binding domain-containing protein n=1 Tax=Paenibacillus thiaminolyticus TaxID=49283 RepID=A0A3A3GVF9_PANTH|nr:AbrB/MazE/SpoVT family DNA-binding domain-containing protein [Paenibacillus thiaminolyticus]RJG17020.1 AbrB/MazE/SpoVT family DNA-binding domain-containing protein [Paenibacillus thiaminolyticus]
MEWKRARVSQKRQVTIPLKFFEQAEIKDEVELCIKGNIIIMRQVREQTGHDSFADLILEDLIKEGFSGDQLLTKFRERQAELHVAIKNVITESEEAARNFRTTNDETADLFGDIMS